MNIYKRFRSWLKYRKHPCYIGNGEFDHTLIDHQDSQGEGVYSMSYSWVECEICGATHDEDAEIPECPEGYFD